MHLNFSPENAGLNIIGSPGEYVFSPPVGAKKYVSSVQGNSFF